MAVFYRKYRPQKLSDIVGQDHVKKTLLAQLESGKVSHGYLFCGPKGTGKTSCARIFAKAVNCLTYAKSKNQKFGEPCNKCISCLSITDGSNLDLLEIDAASNRLISDVRDLIEKIKLSPVSGRFKVYILDEAHMLTPESFNALLKTLEEPPAHAIFILCTTEPSKLPATIISRLLRFNFLKATDSQIGQVVEKIAKSEGISIDKAAILAICEASDGSFRDAVSILDQISATKRKICEEDVKNIAKVIGLNQLFVFIEKLAGNDLKGTVLMIEDIAKVADISLFVREAVFFLEKLLFMKIGVNAQVVLDLDEEKQDEVGKLSAKIDYEDIQKLMRLLLVAESEIKLYPLAQIPLILAVCQYLGNPLTVGDNKTGDEVRDEVLEEENEPEETESTGKKEKIDKKEKQNSKRPKSFAKIENKWDEFLKRVKPVNAHVLALLRSTRPTGFDGDNLVIEVFYRFHKEKLEEPKIIRQLDEILTEVMGGPTRLKLVLAAQESKPTRTVAVSNVLDIGGSDLDDIEKMAKEIFAK